MILWLLTNSNITLLIRHFSNLLSPTDPMKSQSIMMTSGNWTTFCVTGICEENPPVISGFPWQSDNDAFFDVFFDVTLNKWLNKHLNSWRFQMPLRSLWCHCNDFERAERGTHHLSKVISCGIHSTANIVSTFIVSISWSINEVGPKSTANLDIEFIADIL